MSTDTIDVRWVGLKRWQAAVVQQNGQGQRWVRLAVQFVEDGREPLGFVLDVDDAYAMGRALVEHSLQAVARDRGDMN
jgi:hypothetical protein